MTGHLLAIDRAVGRQLWLPRWVHHLYAVVRRRFWVACDRCGQPFGGHQCFCMTPEFIHKRIGYGSCPWCEAELLAGGWRVEPVLGVLTAPR